MEIEEARAEARARAAREASEQVDSMFEDAVRRGPVESPIEQLFLAAFAAVCQIDPVSWKIEPQVPVGKYRLDFLTSFSIGDITEYVAVECDGHDFHEKTKEQAERDKKRDRVVAAAGYTTLRFTGRELFRDPFACADEVADVLQDKAFDRYRELIRARSEGSGVSQ